MTGHACTGFSQGELEPLRRYTKQGLRDAARRVLYEHRSEISWTTEYGLELLAGGFQPTEDEDQSIAQAKAAIHEFWRAS